MRTINQNWNVDDVAFYAYFDEFNYFDSISKTSASLSMISIQDSSSSTHSFKWIFENNNSAHIRKTQKSKCFSYSIFCDLTFTKKILKPIFQEVALSHKINMIKNW